MRVTTRARAIAMLYASLTLPVVASGADVVDPQGWRAVAIRAALSSANDISDPYRAGETFAVIARTQVALGDERGAESSVRAALAKIPSIEQPEFRGWVQYEIVQAQLALNDTIGARETAAAISGERPRGAAYMLLARRALQSGNVQGAESLANTIREPEAAGEVLSEIVATRASQPDVAAARTIQRRIEAPYFAGTALAYIAIAEARAGNMSRARDLVVKAPRAERPHALTQYISWLIERGELRAALELAERIDDVVTRGVVVARIGLESQRQGDASRARELFAAALKLVDDRETQPAHVLMTLVQIARLQALAGFTTEAKATLQRVNDSAAQVQGRDRDMVLEGLARAHLRLGAFEEALAASATIQDRISRALLIRDATALQVGAGAGMAQLVRGDWTSDSLANTAAQFGVLGSRLGGSNANDTRAAIEAARAHVARIEDPLLPPAALAALAAASLRAGDEQLADEIFAELVLTTDRIARPDLRALAYVRVANALNDRLMFLGRPSVPDACADDRADCDAR